MPHRDDPETSDAGCERAAALVERLDAACTALLEVVERVDGEDWTRLPAPGVWSIGKDAEHVSEAALYHQWIVRLTIGEPVASRHPPIPRSRATTSISVSAAAELIRLRTDETRRLVGALTDAQLDLVTRPPRARPEPLEKTIARVLIGHYDRHRAAIGAKLRRVDGGRG